jgi:hypothetical protein
MNRRFVFAILLLVALAFVLLQSVPRASAQAAATEDPLVQLVRDWLAAEARNDHAALNRMIDDGFVGATFNGSILSKDDIVPSDPGANRFPKSSLKEATSRHFGDTGVVVGRIAADDPQQSLDFRCTLVFQKHGDAWKMIAAHMSR